MNRRNESEHCDPGTSSSHRNSGRATQKLHGESNYQPTTSASSTTPKNNSMESTSNNSTTEQQNLEEAIKLGLDALKDLDRANFKSGVHFCPPHFVDHKFFTEEMALAYRNGTLSDGPLRDYQGKIWEELIYHGLMENLPHLLETTEIKSMRVFYGLFFPRNSALLGQISINVPEETEIDLLLVGSTKIGNLFLIPIEIKKAKSDGRTKMGKAKTQCTKYTERLIQVLKIVLQRNDVEHFITPVVLCCHMDNPAEELPVDQSVKKYKGSWRQRDQWPKTFDMYLNKYDELKYNPQSEIQTNLFSWIGQMDFENEIRNCVPSKYQRLIGVLVFISSCKITNKDKHDETTCYRHFQFGGKDVCMNGTMLCPKHVHEYVVKNIDFLTYMKTFYAKNDSELSAPNAFAAYPINKLDCGLRKIVTKYLKNITNEQLKVLMSEERRVVLIGDYGGGKTLALCFKAMEILLKIENGKEFGRIRFMSTDKALGMDVVPKFKEMFNEKTLASMLRSSPGNTFQSITFMRGFAFSMNL